MQKDTSNVLWGFSTRETAPSSVARTRTQLRAFIGYTHISWMTSSLSALSVSQRHDSTTRFVLSSNSHALNFEIVDQPCGAQLGRRQHHQRRALRQVAGRRRL
jgi:hypothetical protein